jgi:hypothetical protein
LISGVFSKYWSQTKTTDVNLGPSHCSCFMKQLLICY